jgi:pyruvate ferredoxin oxidoreductase alpha subunit
VLTHAVEEVEVPEQEQVDRFLPGFRPRQWLDPDRPITIGAMVGPEAFTEVKYLMAHRQLRALDAVAAVGREFSAVFGRSSGGLLHRYRVEGAEVVVVAMGSVLGSLADVVDDLRDEGIRVGALGVTCFRPWPFDDVRTALGDVPRVVVVNRAISVGSGSILGQDVRLTVLGGTTVHDVVLGLGGRPVTRDTLRRLVRDALAGRLESDELTFADLDQDRANSELARELGMASPREGSLP